MWTRAQLKNKAKGAFNMNYWKTVLVAVLVMLIGFSYGAAGGASGGARATYQYSYNEGPYEVTGYIADEMTEEEAQEAFGELYGELEDMDVPADELLSQVGITPTQDGFHFEIGPSQLAALGALGFIVLVLFAIVLVVNAFLLNPFNVGYSRFFLRNLNQPAMVAEIGYSFDNNYRETVKGMFKRDIFTLLWGLLFIIPGIVKSYEYRMIPYLFADDPTMTSDRAFAESRAMMQGNKWRTFVLDLSFLGWNLLSVLTFGLVGVFYAAPYQLQTYAAQYEELRYGASARQLGGYEPMAAAPVQIPVAPFAAEDAAAPADDEGIEE